MRSRDLRHLALLGASLLAVSLMAGAPAVAQLCLSDPISPVCCPSPCPIFDTTRVPKLLADASSLEQAITADRYVVQSMAQLGQVIGNGAATVTSATNLLSAFPLSIPGEMTLTPSALSTNPVAALGTLKQAMFEPGAVGQTSAAQLAARSANRAAAAQQEQVGALATSLMKSNSLPSVTSLQGQLAMTASVSDQLHSDLAANSTVRLAIYQDVGGLHQLTAAWLSQRAAGSALKHPTTAGGAIPQPTMVASEKSPQQPSTTQALTSTADQLVSLHDSRVSAQALMTAYPSLQKTIASAALANQFASAAESSLQERLSALGLASGAMLSQVEKALKTADGSGWLDSGKDTQAQQAAAQVFSALAASGASPSAVIAGDMADRQQTEQAMSAWLDANKQSQYWAELARSAEKAMANLDGRLGALSDRVGLDVAGTSASATEAALLKILKQDSPSSQWQGLIAAASQDPGAQSVLKITVPR